MGAPKKRDVGHCGVVSSDEFLFQASSPPSQPSSSSENVSISLSDSVNSSSNPLSTFASCISGLASTNVVSEGLYDPEEDFFGSAAAYVPPNPSLVLDTSLWRAVSPGVDANHFQPVELGNADCNVGRIEQPTGSEFISLQTVSAQNYEEEVLLAKFPNENGNHGHGGGLSI